MKFHNGLSQNRGIYQINKSPSIDRKLQRTICLVFENNRTEIYDQDGSVFIWSQDKLLYQSKKGIITHMSLETLLEQKTEPIYSKFKKACELVNRHGSYNQYIDIDQNSQQNQLTYLKHRIKQFSWINPQVEEIKIENKNNFGYKISSDDRMASLTLLPDLYLVQISYLQYIERNIGTKQFSKNITKQLLEKHKYQYTQIPDFKPSKNSLTADYIYKKVSKKYTIFNVPSQWQYPLWILWSSLNQYECINPGIAYIQYDWVQSQSSLKINKSKICMPTLTKMQDLLNKTANKCQKISIPILGRINHEQRCLYGNISKKNRLCFEFWQCVKYGVNIGHDNYGYWILIENSSEIQYKSRNCKQIKQKYYTNAIPYKIKIAGEPQKYLSEELLIFTNYSQQNDKKTKLINNNRPNNERLTKISNQNDEIRVIAQQKSISPIQINYKAYSSGYVYLQVPSHKLSLSLNAKQNHIKIFTANNPQPIYIILSNPQSFYYQQYQMLINQALDFNDRVFNPQKYQQNLKLKQAAQDILRSSDLYIKGCQYLKSTIDHNT